MKDGTGYWFADGEIVRDGWKWKLSGVFDDLYEAIEKVQEFITDFTVDMKDVCVEYQWEFYCNEAHFAHGGGGIAVGVTLRRIRMNECRPSRSERAVGGAPSAERAGAEDPAPRRGWRLDKR